jgi:hypothetical protein
MGYVGWGSVANQANTETGGAEFVVADVTGASDIGVGVAGTGVVNLYSGVPPTPPVSIAFIELEGTVTEFLLQEGGAPPIRIQLES